MPSRSSQDDRGSEPFARIGLFDMPKGRLIVVKEDYSGKIHLYIVQSKSKRVL